MVMAQGSSEQIPIRFFDEQGNLFAKMITEGLELGFEYSHPNIAQA